MDQQPSRAMSVRTASTRDLPVLSPMPSRLQVEAAAFH
jgi:hypothetical protein